MSFIFGFLVGAAAVLLLPQEKTDQLRSWINTQWKKLTKKG